MIQYGLRTRSRVLVDLRRVTVILLRGSYLLLLMLLLRRSSC